MLFNPIWNKTTKHAEKDDAFSLGHLIAWLKTRHPDARYDYVNCFNCLLAQYFTDQGYKHVTLSRNFVTYDGPHLVLRDTYLLPEHFDWIASAEPHNYGSALKRAQLALRDPAEALLESLPGWKS